MTGDQSRPLLLVRYIPGLVGESQRSVHLVLQPDHVDFQAGKLTALCGATFGPGELDLLDRFTGMPCNKCIALSTPTPGLLAHAEGDWA